MDQDCTCPGYTSENTRRYCRACVDRLRAHVSRLEESLRVALEARAEAVEVLREVEWGDTFKGRRWCPVCSGVPGDAECCGHSDDCRLARAIGKGE